MIPPEVAVSDYFGTVKGRTAIRIFDRFGHLTRTGEIILGQGILCDYGGFGYREDQGLNPIVAGSGSTRTYAFIVTLSIGSLQFESQDGEVIPEILTAAPSDSGTFQGIDTL